jgi:hypothetical protein
MQCFLIAILMLSTRETDRLTISQGSDDVKAQMVGPFTKTDILALPYKVEQVAHKPLNPASMSSQPRTPIANNSPTSDTALHLQNRAHRIHPCNTPTRRQMHLTVFRKENQRLTAWRKGSL